MAAATPSISAQTLYHDHVWPALWDVLKLSSASSMPGERHRSTNQHKSCHTLQCAVTHALLRLLRGVKDEEKISSETLEGVSSQLLLHTHGVEPTPPHNGTATEQRGVLGSAASSGFTPANATAAMEVERLYVLICTAIQLSAQADLSVLSSDGVSATVVRGAPTAAVATSAAAATTPEPAQLPCGVALASRTVVAGIYGVARHLAPTAATTNIEQDIQPLWFAFLFIYLQQLSAHTPKDTSMYARFLDSCGKEHGKRVATDPLSSDDDNNNSKGDINGTESSKKDCLGTSGCAHCGGTSTRANDLAALRAWSQVSPDLLKDTVARTRFRRAALLFKSFTPHMTTQAPTLVFLLVDLLCEYSRSWTAWLQRVPLGSVEERLATRLTQYTTRSITRDSVPSFHTSSAAAALPHAAVEQWQQAQSLVEAYGDRLALLLGEGTPHAHLVATVVCAVLSSLYVLPHIRRAGVSATEVSTAVLGSASPATSPIAGKLSHTDVPGGGSAATAVRGRRDEEAAVLEVEAAYHLPRRGACMLPLATVPSPSSESYPNSPDAACMSEAEWRLRHYTPVGQLLAHVHLVELQKVHLFSVAGAQMRVGRTAAQQAEHARLLALTTLYCGVAGWDLALLLYHVADYPLPPFISPDISSPPPLPSAALARYTAAVQHYVEQSRAELIVNTAFVELQVGGNDRYGGGSGSGARRRRQQQQQQQQAEVRSTIPSRGELHTPRFIEMVNPDPVLLSWRAHLVAAETTLAATASASPSATQKTGSKPSSPTPGVVDGASATSTKTTTATTGVSPTPAAAGATGSTSATTVHPTGTTGGSDVLLSPCCFIRDLLIAGQYTLATAGMKYLSESPFAAEHGSNEAAATCINVLLPPRRAFPHHISVVFYVSVVLRRWLQRWETLQELQQQESRSMGDLRHEVFAVLRSLFPLLSTVQSYLANQTLLTRLSSRLAWLSKETVSAAAAAGRVGVKPLERGTASPAPVFALVEQMLIHVIMPCLRVLPPALAVYDALDDIMDVFTRFSLPQQNNQAVISYGSSPAAPLHLMEWLAALLPSPSMVTMYRTKQQQDVVDSTMREVPGTSPALVYPHDALMRKEREALLSQSLKRLNAENIEEYQAALRPILYAEPLLVAHRLFVQAIGYNNNFLNVHTHLLHGLPRTILTLILQQGLVLMARYAAEEKVTDTSSECRTAILATFLATIWRDNVSGVDGVMLVRCAELALRSDSGHNILLGTELCKALLAVMAYRTLEHEEKFSAAQLQALALTPSTTSLFGRGAMTSFRMRCWADTGSALLLLSPTDVFVAARRALADALQQPCVAPLRGAEGDAGDGHNEEEEESTASGDPSSRHVETGLTLGQLLLVHLCRLQNRIYELQRDLDGGAELILLASAERFNTITDMVVVLEELCPSSATRAVVDRLCTLVRQVALPQVALYIETQHQRKFVARESATSRALASLAAADAVYLVPVPSAAFGSSTDGSVGESPPSSVLRLLPYFTAAHFEYSPIPYAAARQEWQQCMQRAQRLHALHHTPTSNSAAGAMLANRNDAALTRRAAAIITWLKTEEARMNAEEAAHRHLVDSSVPARAALLQAFVRDFIPANPHDAASVAAADDAIIDFAMSYLLPRAVMNLREAATVAAFFTWLFQEVETSGAAAVKEQPEQGLLLMQRRATDLALTFVSAAFTYFVAYTDGECKRLGYVLQRLLEIPALSSHQQQLQSVAALSPELIARLPQLLSTPRQGENSAAGDGLEAARGNASAAAAAEGVAGVSSVARKREPAVSAVSSHRSISNAFFTHFFLGVGDKQLISSSPSSSSATSLAAPPSLWSVAVARGLVVDAEVPVSAPGTAAVETKQPAAESPAALPSAASLSAIPLQLESYVCRALVQLFTNDGDVPPYAQRNQLLVLEQLDKTTFPSTLCALDVLIRAVEPHASKAKSYYALASAVLKSLRVNRRRRREAQQTVVMLSRGEEAASAGQSDSLDSPAASSGAAALTTTVSESLKESAAACHVQWRLREHYMKQLLQVEVAQLLSDQQVRLHEESEDEVEQEEREAEREKQEGGDATENKELEAQGQQQQSNQDEESDTDEDNDASSFADGEEGDGEEEGEGSSNVAEEGEEDEEGDEEDDAGSYSGDDESQESEVAGDATRKRQREA
jgi:hypothetical protein